MAKKKPKTKAKKQAKKKAKQAPAAVFAKWEGITWKFEGGDDGDLVKNSPNKFTLVALDIGQSGNHPLMYVLKSAPDTDGTHGVTSFWQDMKLIWQPGMPFDMGFGPFGGPPPQEAVERNQRYQKTKNTVEPVVARVPFERLLGVGKLPTGNKDAIVTFMVAEKNFTDGVKAIIVGRVDFKAASPGGAAVGNG